MSTGHAVSRSVRDSAALLDAVAGPAPGDPYWAQPPESSFLSSLDQSTPKLHIALCLTPPNEAKIHPTCVTAARDAAALCEELGHTVEEVRLPVGGGELRYGTGVVVRTKVAQMLDERAQQLGRDLTEEDIERATWWLYQRGKTVTGTEYSSAVDTIHRIGRQVALFMQSHDMILSPVLAEPPALLGRMDMMSDDPAAYFETLAQYSPFTSLANVTGQPSMSVPLALSDDGLPIGVLFSARYGDEVSLFRLARQLERSRPWGMAKLKS
jgi:Asp-tRNA(Asn)/Glu-tRNA(Gln) amidotransferase A subunit family amidase